MSRGVMMLRSPTSVHPEPVEGRWFPSARLRINSRLTTNGRRSVWRVAVLAALAATALLAVIIAPGAQPAAAQEQETVFHHTATLKAKAQRNGSLGCANHLDNPCHDAGNLSDNSFTYGGVDRQITWALLDTEGSLDLAVAPYQKADEVEGLTLRVGVEKTVNGVTTVEIRSFDLTSDVREGGNFKWTSTGMSWQEDANVYLVFTTSQDFAELTFGGATIDDRTYTAGGEVSFLGLSEAEKDALRLPMAMGGGYTHTYTATGLPAGLYMDYARQIRGTPEAATTSPATVTYTATDENGGSVSLTFEVSVAPPVGFDAAQLATFKNTIFEYTVGQAEQINATLPAASGGHGTLSYGLTYWVKEQRVVDGRQISGEVEKSVNDDAPGFSFDASTRVLSSDTGTSAPSADAFYSVDYWAEDENGARAIASNSIAVNEAPSIRAIADQSFTVGQNVSITLPAAEGGTTVGIGMRYELEPAVEGLVFNRRQHLRSLTGAPTVPGTTEVTYTATDRNDVSATQTFDITVVNGPSAPSSAPSSVKAAQVSSGADPNGSGAAATWDTVSGATGYVVQVMADGGSFPDLKVESAPTLVTLRIPDDDKGLVWINAISTGDYKVRVAARNADGVGPWSSEVSFTVTPGGL